MEVKQIHKSEKDAFVGFAQSRIGGRPENQDNFGFKSTKIGLLVTVCDGMGGGPGGRTASTIAVKTIMASVDAAPIGEDVCTTIANAIKAANLAVYEYGMKEPSLRGMGSTATVLLLSEESACIAHVGDSRVYQLRGGKKAFRTDDHSMVFGLVHQKVITEEQARLSAQSNVITRALGIKPEVEVDVAVHPYLKGDRFVLCTDGVHGTMPEKELIERLSNKKHQLGVLTDDMLTYVDAIGNNSGGHHDNMTIAIVETNRKSKLSVPMSSTAKITIVALLVLCIASVVLNVCQYKGVIHSSSLVTADSIAKIQKNDSTNFAKEKKSLNDSIVKLNKKIPNATPANNQK